MTSIGERLRRQRLQNQISLEKISLDTKIGIRLLEAIEAEQFEKLPGGVFRKSFVLLYANALGVVAGEIANELKQLNQFDDVPAIPTPEMMHGHEPLSGSPMSQRLDMSGLGGSTVGSLLAAVGVIMLCALIYSWWQTPRQADVREKVEAVQQRRLQARHPAAMPGLPLRLQPRGGAGASTAASGSGRFRRGGSSRPKCR